MGGKTSTTENERASRPIRGYLEGYYGKLLSWSERDGLVNFLSAQNLNTYCYAPKEDVQHRLRWRESHSRQWQSSFARFCSAAADRGVSVVAGIAPGLDFHFKQNNNVSDFDCLRNKAEVFSQNGADHILILWDDIDDRGIVDANGLSEGAAHARTVNQLSDALGQPLWTVPRVYAAEIENTYNYLNAVVAGTITRNDLTTLSGILGGKSATADAEFGPLRQRTILWDNFYANDYCPRRLFIGPWTGREQISDFLLNPTGLPYTDKLLLDIAASTHTSTNRQQDWANTLLRHDVPETFLKLAPYFCEPFFGDRELLGDARDTMRETLPRDRVVKTQPCLLAQRLLNGKG